MQILLIKSKKAAVNPVNKNGNTNYPSGENDWKNVQKNDVKVAFNVLYTER